MLHRTSGDGHCLYEALESGDYVLHLERELNGESAAFFVELEAGERKAVVLDYSILLGAGIPTPGVVFRGGQPTHAGGMIRGSFPNLSTAWSGSCEADIDASGAFALGMRRLGRAKINVRLDPEGAVPYAQ